MESKSEVPPTSNFYVIDPDAIDSDDAPPGFPFDVKKACIVRLKALANGAIYVLQQKTGKDDTIAAVKNLVDARSKAIKAMVYDPAKKKAFFNELRQFNLDLAKAAGLADKDIALGEAFWAWQEYKRPETREKTYQDGDLTVTQTETLLCSRLTQEQKKDLLKIHQEAKGQPKWFKNLPAWAQSSLKSIVPKNLEDKDWIEYEKKIIPATLRHIPGQANATKHELTIKNGEQDVSHTTAYKQGVPTSYDMPEEDRQASATQNVAQMLGDIGSDANRKKAFNSYWDITDESSTLYDTIKPPVFLGGLLTPSSQGNRVQKFIDWTGLSGKENNSTLDSDKSAAIQSFIKSRTDKASYFDINVPLNGNRNATPVSVDASFLYYATTVSTTITATGGFGDKATQLAEAVKLLGEHNDLPEPPGRNKNLYTAALYELTTRLMGGCSTGNCKSSKDRKGVELMMADAMMIYYAKYNKFPKCDDKDEGDNLDRTNFINIFVNLYNSGHQLYIAHDNSPGSAGIKDEKILDKDIIKALGESYTKSKEIAEFNKPKTFFDKHAKKIPGLGFILSKYETATSWFKNWLSWASSSSFDGQGTVASSPAPVPPSDAQKKDSGSLSGSNSLEHTAFIGGARSPVASAASGEDGTPHSTSSIEYKNNYQQVMKQLVKSANDHSPATKNPDTNSPHL